MLVSILLATLMGAVFGSAASALSYRLPRGLPVFLDRSRCPHCNSTLAAYDLVPIISWVIMKGRCRHCRTSISFRYPALEIISATLFTACWIICSGHIIPAAILCLTAFGLLVIVQSDLETGLIPDAALLLLVPVAIGWRYITGGEWLDACLGAITGLAVTVAVKLIFQALRGRDGLGLGDIKLITLAGFYIGVHAGALGWFLVLSSAIGIGFGLIWRSAGERVEQFPFGPSLCAALFAFLLASSILL